jgi:hypothetical protein
MLLPALSIQPFSLPHGFFELLLELLALTCDVRAKLLGFPVLLLLIS